MRGIELALSSKDIVWYTSEAIKIAVLTGFAVACIDVTKVPGWESIVGKQSLGHSIQSWMFTLGGARGGEAEAASTLGQAAGAFADSIVKLYSAKVIPADWGLLRIISHFVEIIVACLFLIAACLALSVAAALTIGHMFVGMLLMSLAIALAPVLVPAIMVRPLNFLFDAWLKTLLIGGMMVVVGRMFIEGGKAFALSVEGMAGSLSQTLPQTEAQRLAMDTYAINGFDLIAVYGTVFLAALLFIMIAGKIDDMARTLISGSGVSGFGINDFRLAVAATNRSGVSAAGSAARAGGAAAGAAFAARSGGSAMKAAGDQFKAKNGREMNPAERKATQSAMRQAFRDAATGSTSARGAGAAAGMRTAQAMAVAKPAAGGGGGGGGGAPSTPFPKITP